MLLMLLVQEMDPKGIVQLGNFSCHDSDAPKNQIRLKSDSLHIPAMDLNFMVRRVSPPALARGLKDVGYYIESILRCPLDLEFLQANTFFTSSIDYTIF